jgi:hypothetical protein
MPPPHALGVRGVPGRAEPSASLKAPKREDGTYFGIGVVCFLDHLQHLIPFPRSCYRQEAEICFSEDGILLFWDSFCAGRVACGGRFGFDRLCR